MSKMQATSEPAAAEADRKSCGGEGHDKHVQRDRFTVKAQGQRVPSTHGTNAGYSARASCCCGRKAAR